MTKPSSIAALLVLAAGLAFASGPAMAQAQVSDPVVVKSPKPSTKLLKYSGTVIIANASSITLRNPKNPQLSQAFSFSPEVRDQMVKILSKGGFQYGDKVTVEHPTGSNVAEHLHGKPSKPRHS